MVGRVGCGGRNAMDSGGVASPSMHKLRNDAHNPLRVREPQHNQQSCDKRACRGARRGPRGMAAHAARPQGEWPRMQSKGWVRRTRVKPPLAMVGGQSHALVPKSGPPIARRRGRRRRREVHRDPRVRHSNWAEPLTVLGRGLARGPSLSHVSKFGLCKRLLPELILQSSS